MGSICVCKINYARNCGGNALMCKYCYNNHHIEGNLESVEVREILQFIRLQIKLFTMNFTWWWKYNDEGLILVTWGWMLNCGLTHQNILAFTHNNLIMCILLTAPTRTELAKCCIERMSQNQSSFVTKLRWRPIEF